LGISRWVEYVCEFGEWGGAGWLSYGSQDYEEVEEGADGYGCVGGEEGFGERGFGEEDEEEPEGLGEEGGEGEGRLDGGR